MKKAMSLWMIALIITFPFSTFFVYGQEDAGSLDTALTDTGEQPFNPSAPAPFAGPAAPSAEEVATTTPTFQFQVQTNGQWYLTDKDPRTNREFDGFGPISFEGEVPEAHTPLPAGYTALHITREEIERFCFVDPEGWKNCPSGDSIRAPDEKAIADAQKMDGLASWLDNGILQTLEQVFALAYFISSVMQAINSMMVFTELMIGTPSTDGGPCITRGIVGDESICASWYSIYKGWRNIYSKVEPNFICFMNCGWCTGTCDGFFGGTIGNFATKFAGYFDKANISPYDNIIVASACMCPGAILYNLRKLRTIYQIRNCCVSGAIENGYSPEVCDEGFDVATCYYFEGAIVGSLVKVATGVLFNLISKVVAKATSSFFMNGWVQAGLQASQMVPMFKGLIDAYTWMDRSFAEPSCDELDFGNIEEEARVNANNERDTRLNDYVESEGIAEYYDRVLSYYYGIDGFKESYGNAVAQKDIQNLLQNYLGGFVADSVTGMICEGGYNSSLPWMDKPDTTDTGTTQTNACNDAAENVDVIMTGSLARLADGSGVDIQYTIVPCEKPIHYITYVKGPTAGVLHLDSSSTPVVVGKRVNREITLQGPEDFTYVCLWVSQQDGDQIHKCFSNAGSIVDIPIEETTDNVAVANDGTAGDDNVGSEGGEGETESTSLECPAGQELKQSPNGTPAVCCPAEQCAIDNSCQDEGYRTDYEGAQNYQCNSGVWGVV